MRNLKVMEADRAHAGRDQKLPINVSADSEDALRRVVLGEDEGTWLTLIRRAGRRISRTKKRTVRD